MDYIFDASFVGTLIISDEQNTNTFHLYKKIKNEDYKYTPNLFWYEVSNIFKNLLLRKRYSAEEVALLFPMVESLGLITDFNSGISYSKKIWEFSKNYNLSVYDAAYLELADRKKAILCTLDEDLQNAAKKHGVQTIT